MKSTLVTVSPLSTICSTDYDDHENDHETNAFNAEVHIHYFEISFILLSLNFKNWIFSQIADSAAVIKKIGQIISVPHIGCINHKLAQ